MTRPKHGAPSKYVYSISLSAPDEDGTVCVSASQLREVRTFGHDREHAIEMAVDAVHVAVSARIHLGVPIPPSDASPQDDLKVVVDVPPAPRSQRVHEAAINSETLVVFPAGEEALPPTVLMHVVRVLKLDVKGVMDMLKCDEEVARELLEGEEPDNAEPPSAGQPAADAGASPQ